MRGEVITGGSSGIGLATAQRFVSEEGAYVFITGLSQSELRRYLSSSSDVVSSIPLLVYALN
jgi:NAD(P)-dependent dehydrogenase (short-subunit alcohol dehydrogenase family)